MVRLRQATTEDLEEVLRNRRPIGKIDPEFVRALWGASEFRDAADINDELAAVFGVTKPNDVLSPAGIWLITTPIIDKNKVTFVKWAWWRLEGLLGVYGGLFGFVEDGCPTRWLERLGFIFEEPQGGFRRFEKWLPQHHSQS